MSVRNLPPLVGALVFVVAAAQAEPVTYAGKIGSADIVVEFTSDPSASDGPLAGRYFYRSQGVDIPLQARPRKGRRFELAEEEVCGAEQCGNGQAAPAAAIWRLASADKGKTLEGTWNGKKTRPVKLTRISAREQTQTPASRPFDLHDFTETKFFGDDAPIKKRTEPTDAGFEAECGTDELIGEYLAASVKRDGDTQRLVFGLQSLPHAIQVCGGDFLELPAADASALLKPEFARLLGQL
ncbi:hypothetical protein FJ434_07250 [Mesorhizobium sp. B2-5-13]|uniref:hypothetical protein n=1 Tax=unclassified Mesorhizobium TaxID=325217 RepID=UPI001129B641|nr:MULTISPECIES: hypothetical protein [unclassified Mesorhizobium]TPJ44217.1 hypothetical protein FJ432_04200 [Mesorhizobium sp. B2-6-5]TPJ90779.1 hypothetical protein FJ434_07250 [Mesorhizobium sp. B2-5-13]TPK54588.1 hypothetical protein FJ560_01225 [Mesorhizobium sp. B2-5-5]